MIKLSKSKLWKNTTHTNTKQVLHQITKEKKKIEREDMSKRYLNDLPTKEF